MQWLRLIFFAWVLSSCGGGMSRGTMRIGIDTKWYPIDFGPQTPYVNGYTEELLLEMARYSGMQFELISTNWDALVEGLREGKYDAILTSLPPYEYHLAKFDFSKNYLDLGPVLILPLSSPDIELQKMKGSMVGILMNDPAAILIEKNASLIIRTFSSIPDLLNAVAAGQVEAALLSRTPAVNYVRDLYADRLKIVGQPLTNAGLHLVAQKGRGGRFDQMLEALKKKKVLKKLMEKWQL